MHEVNPDSPTLPNNQAEDFHSIIENILWRTNQAKPDIETVVAFICT